jgi:hypothetical protein
LAGGLTDLSGLGFTIFYFILALADLGLPVLLITLFAGLDFITPFLDAIYQ